MHSAPSSLRQGHSPARVLRGSPGDAPRFFGAALLAFANRAFVRALPTPRLFAVRARRLIGRGLRSGCFVTAIATGGTALSGAESPLLLWAVGPADDGSLGDGRIIGVPTPVLTGVSKAAAGQNHTLILRNDGTAWASGEQFLGQLGDGTEEIYRALPVQILRNVVDIAAGNAHSLFLKSDGTLWGTGDNSRGQLGGTAGYLVRSPRQIASDVIAMAAGGNHTVYLTTEGKLWGLGDNSAGQLGLPPATKSSATPLEMAAEVTAVAAGALHTVFIKSDRTLWSAGNDTVNPSTFDRPLQVAADVVAAAAGQRFTLFLKSDRSLWGVGTNESGALGLPNDLVRLTPAQITTNVTQIAAGRDHSLFIRADGSLWGAGGNGQGQLGAGAPEKRSSPVRLASGVKFASAGAGFTLFVSSDGILSSVGANASGQLADGTISDHRTPFLVSASATAVAASADTSHAAFITSNGDLWTMGENDQGQLGDGSTARRTAPIRIATEVSKVAVGAKRTFFIKRDGTLWGAGQSPNGELGDGNQVSRQTPVQIATGVTAVATGSDNTVFIKSDGTAWGMGRNVDPMTPARTTPLMLRGAGYVNAAPGARLIDIDGTLWAPKTGMPAEANQLAPAASGVRSVSAYNRTMVFVRNDDTLWGSGDNMWGQLNNVSTFIGSPVQLFSGVKSASAGRYVTLFVKTDGSLWCKGYASDTGFTGGEVMFGEPFKILDDVESAVAGPGVTYFMQAAGHGAAPRITRQPQPVLFTLNSSFSLSVEASSGSLVDFRWRKDGIDLPAARSATFYIPLAQRSHAGEYEVVVTNSGGSVTSLRVSVAPFVATIASQPAAELSATAGESVTLAVTATSPEALTYQWRKNGAPLPGATAATLTLAQVQPSDSGLYTLAITSAQGTLISSGSTLTVAESKAPPASRLVNLSVRTQAGAGDDLLVVGFALGGNGAAGPASLLVRAVGPSLAAFGLSDFLADPSIVVQSGTQVVAQNDNWEGTPALAAAMQSVGAFALSGPGARDAALVANLSGGGFTATVVPAAGTSGNTLVEIYEVPPAVANTRGVRLINLSARARTGGRAGPLVAGFVVSGEVAKTLLVRATGPALAAFGVPGTITNPKLELFRAGAAAPLAINDDWGGSAELSAAFTQAGAFPLAAGSRDAALVISVAPGSYTAQVTDVAAQAGVALIEVYDLDP